ncbi:MAG: hypothetical protein PHC89_02560 [Candidatus Pacebacteria bacterium]|nr:hypothetical protein [Candidatus Paceibacterota bacterium]
MKEALVRLRKGIEEYTVLLEENIGLQEKQILLQEEYAEYLQKEIEIQKNLLEWAGGE